MPWRMFMASCCRARPSPQLSIPKLVHLPGISRGHLALTGGTVSPGGTRTQVPACGMGLSATATAALSVLLTPGAVGTYSNGINDSGVIVGVYYDVNYKGHGFIYHNGQWATLDFINGSTGSGLIGITNSGAILGEGSGSCNSMGCGLSGAFLYVNGTFKDLPEVPNSKNPPGSAVSST